MTTRQKLFGTAGIVAAVAAIGGLGAFSAFTATTQNDNNTIEVGSVSVSDSDGGSGVLYSATNIKPGTNPTSRCIRVTYSGSLTANVKLYRGSVSNGDKFNLLIERGTTTTAPDSTMTCSGFSATSTAYNGTLQAFPSSYATSTVDGKASAATWSAGNTQDYRFTISAVDDTTANARTSTFSTGNHSFFWEAQNN